MHVLSLHQPLTQFHSSSCKSAVITDVYQHLFFLSFSFLLSLHSSLALIFTAHFLLPLLCSNSSEAAHCEENDLQKTFHSEFDQSWHSKCQM